MSDLEDALDFQIRAVGLPEPGREWRFHPTRKWRFDLARPDLLLAVEVDGGTWTQGRHTRGFGYRLDCEKMNEAQLLGWRVLRVTRGMIEDGTAIRTIERAFEVMSFGKCTKL